MGFCQIQLFHGENLITLTHTHTHCAACVCVRGQAVIQTIISQWGCGIMYQSHVKHTTEISHAATVWRLQSDVLGGRHKQLVHTEGVTLRWKEFSFILPPSSSYPPSAKPKCPSPAFNILLTRLFRSTQLFCLSVWLSMCRDRFLGAGRVITFHQPCTITWKH